MVEVVELSAAEAGAQMDTLAALLVDVVAGGASVGFMADISRVEAQDFWRETVAGIESGRTILFAAFDGGRLVGTVLLHPCGKPNQPHRADVTKLLVHRTARRARVATRLMEALEARALGLGRTLLTLDTASGSDAEHFYRRRGYQPAGEIPGYALMPDGAPTGTTFYYKQLGE
jgi:GNAT superfamily N-acetyltransferase